MGAALRSAMGALFYYSESIERLKKLQAKERWLNALDNAQAEARAKSTRKRLSIKPKPRRKAELLMTKARKKPTKTKASRNRERPVGHSSASRYKSPNLKLLHRQKPHNSQDRTTTRKVKKAKTLRKKSPNRQLRGLKSILKKVNRTADYQKRVSWDRYDYVYLFTRDFD
ncbi:hypothetical protein ElyMa_004372500 [Elysia marginata]|uniref:Uncharacterized protein n=1 Tax=Elysia marginata TaxID=1093978 RepID=A0AAV4H630_9GAST|nr:hypothetical protein ElyMa_004372500 [Elysia marginata]